MSELPELSVVLPALDEEGSLRTVLPRLRAAFGRLGVRGEMIVVDGGSRDGTAAAAFSEGARVLAQRGPGFGSALREGLLAARAPWVAVLDADGSHPPETLERLWARRGEAELIIGSRFCAGGSAVMPLSRLVLSRLLNGATRLLGLPARDASSGLRLYRADLARAACAGSAAPDFSVQQELLAGVLEAGGRVLEVPFRYEPRLGGRSKASAQRLAPVYLRLLARLARRRSSGRAMLLAACLVATGVPVRAGWAAAELLTGALRPEGRLPVSAGSAFPAGLSLDLPDGAAAAGPMGTR